MHTKLSQAVQLYDHLLNEQLSQRTYGPPASTAQAQAPYQAQSQWVPRQTASPTTTATSYNPTYTTTPAVPQQPQWALAAPPVQQMMYNPPPAVSSPVAQYQPLQQQQTYQTLPPVAVQPHQPQTQTQPSAPPQTLTSPPPVPVPAPPTAANMPGVHPHTQAPALSRHASVSQAHRPASMAFPPQRAGTGLHRSATISSATSYTPHPRQTYIPAPQQQQPAQTSAPQPQPVQPQAPIHVPVFPTAPTNAPAAYSLFGAPQVPAQQPREEPKEALLIEL
jgi:growth factor-regulated tyrosine kinase substrate